jgi:hypothetical protein
MSAYGMQVGTPELRSAGPIAFGPENILFLADNGSASVLAVDVADPGPAGGSEPFDLDGVDLRLASFLGCDVNDIVIRDMAVHPISHHVYLSVQRGLGDAGQPVLVRVDRLTGAITDVPLVDVPFARTSIVDAPAEDDERVVISLPQRDDEGEELTFGERTIRILRQPIRTATVTDMAYIDGTLLVAGLSNEEFSSKLRRIPFPFEEGVANNLEIFHVSHGKWETEAPIRTFVPYDGGRSIVASYTCTPVVHFPLGDLAPGTKTVGRTVAELGAVNTPIDMVSFRQGGEEYLLVSNTSHGLLKLSSADIDAQVPLTEPKEPVGVPREREDLEGITQLDNLNGDYVLALQRDETGRQHLRSLKAASL